MLSQIWRKSAQAPPRVEIAAQFDSTRKNSPSSDTVRVVSTPMIVRQTDVIRHLVAQQKDHEDQTETLHESMRRVTAKMEDTAAEICLQLRLRAEYSWQY